MTYKTVLQYGESTHIVKKSRFIGYAMPVSTQDEALEFINTIKQKHKDARHNVSAYLLRTGEKRYSDDGEPQGTAGVPTLEVIEKQGLCDVCIVVTRYFGGILLGTGGLVRAYSQAASQSLEAAQIVTMTKSRLLEVELDYTLYGKVNYILPTFTNKLIDSSFEDLVRLKVAIKSDEADKFVANITELSAGKSVPKELEEKYFAF